MVYIGPDGSVSDTKPRRKSSFITDIFTGIFGFFGLLLSTITGNPNRIRVSNTAD